MIKSYTFEDNINENGEIAINIYTYTHRGVKSYKTKRAVSVKFIK